MGVDRLTVRDDTTGVEVRLGHGIDCVAVQLLGGGRPSAAVVLTAAQARDLGVFLIEQARGAVRLAEEAERV